MTPNGLLELCIATNERWAKMGRADEDELNALLAACGELPHIFLKQLCTCRLLMSPDLSLPAANGKVLPSTFHWPDLIANELIFYGLAAKLPYLDDDDDLFDQIDLLPTAVIRILSEFDREVIENGGHRSPELNQRLLEAIEPYGFTFDCNQDLEPTHLHAIHADVTPWASASLGH